MKNIKLMRIFIIIFGVIAAFCIFITVTLVNQNYESGTLYTKFQLLSAIWNDPNMSIESDLVYQDGFYTKHDYTFLYRDNRKYKNHKLVFTDKECIEMSQNTRDINLSQLALSLLKNMNDVKE
jgi:hypothetical protein